MQSVSKGSPLSAGTIRIVGKPTESYGKRGTAVLQSLPVTRESLRREQAVCCPAGTSEAGCLRPGVSAPQKGRVPTTAFPLLWGAAPGWL